jgi:hypothetical protein
LGYQGVKSLWNYVRDKWEVSTVVKTQQRFQKYVKEYRVRTIYLNTCWEMGRDE